METPENVWNLLRVSKDTKTTSLTSIVNSEQISHIVLAFPLLTLNNKISAKKFSFRKASVYLKH